MGKVVKKIGKSIGKVAKIAAPALSFVPGLGPIASAAAGGLGAVLTGDNRKEILGSAIQGGLGGLAAGGLGGLFGGGGAASGAAGGGGGFLSGITSKLGGLGSLLGLGGGQQQQVDEYGIPYASQSDLNQFGLTGMNRGPLSFLGGLVNGGGRDGQGNWGMLGDLLGGGMGGAQAGGAQAGGGGFNMGGMLPLLASGGLGYLLANQLGKGSGSGSGSGSGNNAKQASVMDQATTDYFNRPTRTLDMRSFGQAAQAAGNDPTTHAALNWGDFMRGGGYYNVPAPAAAATPAPAPATEQPQAAMAEGGSVAELLELLKNPAGSAAAPGELERKMPWNPSEAMIDPDAMIQNLPGAITEAEMEFLRRTGRMPPMSREQRERFMVPYARGGLSVGSSRYVKGSGSGRADTIDAKLSDGEFVVDAETVSMLGDGSNDEGAQILEEMRKRVRAHKGKALAKGKFSPNAKSPLAYMQGGSK